MSTPAAYLIQSIRSAQRNSNDNKSGKHIEYPCSICDYEVKNNNKAILCTSCELWSDIRCNNISVNEYKERQRRNLDNPDSIENEIWICMRCTLLERSDFIPFIFSSVTELNNLNSLDSIII